MIYTILRFLFFLLIAKPLSLVILGLNIRGKKNLPKKGPSIILANHNSHLDTLVLISLFPIEMVMKIRPVAAEEYFSRNRFVKWFAEKIIGIIPIKRCVKEIEGDPFIGVKRALNKKQIVIFFPEGTRGKPEEMSPIKSGIYRLIKELDEIEVVPIFLSGLGKALPKKESILVPFHVNVHIGKALDIEKDRKAFMQSIHESFHILKEYKLISIEESLK